MDPRLPLHVHPDIHRAKTLPGWVYSDPGTYQLLLRKAFGPSWQWLPVIEPPAAVSGCLPFRLLPGSLDEPLLLTRDDAGLHCVSNVCTHRGALLLEEPGEHAVLRCPYHGRCFTPAGQFQSMPHFQGAEDFPRPEDDLAPARMEEWGALRFVSLEPGWEFGDLFGPLRERLDFAPLERMVHDPAQDRDFTFDANWALYCDNFLEGFHIPFVHPTLKTALDWSEYRIGLFDRNSVQIGIAADPADAFDLPAGHPDHGRNVGVYYWFVFPNLMFNVYPWGVSLNVVLPQGPERTTVQFRRFVWDDTRRDVATSQGLDGVEEEDEVVVMSVQRAIHARLYRRGRYSPRQELAVHHFHRWLARLID